MSDDLEFSDLETSLNNANYHACCLNLDDIANKIQELIEEVKKERKKRFYFG